MQRQEHHQLQIKVQTNVNNYKNGCNNNLINKDNPIPSPWSTIPERVIGVETSGTSYISETGSGLPSKSECDYGYDQNVSFFVYT